MSGPFEGIHVAGSMTQADQAWAWRRRFWGLVVAFAMVLLGVGVYAVRTAYWHERWHDAAIWGLQQQVQQLQAVNNQLVGYVNQEIQARQPPARAATATSGPTK